MRLDTLHQLLPDAGLGGDWHEANAYLLIPAVWSTSKRGSENGKARHPVLAQKVPVLGYRVVDSKCSLCESIHELDDCSVTPGTSNLSHSLGNGQSGTGDELD